MKSAWIALGRRLGALLHRGRLERELDEELAFHRALQAERGGGRFGNEVRIREEARAAWLFAWLEDLEQDLRFALRSLRRTPGFTLGVVAMLGLGIGANSAIFSLAYGVLWKSLPYPEPGRIVDVRQAKGAMRHMKNSGADIAAARQTNTGLTGWAMYREEAVTLTGAGVPTVLWGAAAESGLFRLLGVKPVAGRLLGPEDEGAGAAPAVMIGEGLWRERWGGRKSAMGATVVLDGQPYTLVGVLPASFGFPGPMAGMAAAFWRGWREPLEDWGDRDLGALARLGAGVTLAQAQARLDQEMARLADAHRSDQGWRFALMPMRQRMVADAAAPLWTMLAVVAAVLLIAAANLAALLLARAQQRERELATRAALGASRARILRQLLTETALLLGAGTAVGLALALAGIAGLRALAPASVPRMGGVGMNWPVAGFTLLLALVVGALFGLWPAVQASAPRLDPRLRARAESSRGGRARAALVCAQTALALLLLVGAGLMLKAFVRMGAVPLGFNPGHAMTFDLELPAARYPDVAARRRFYAAARQRLQALPGVEAVAEANALPLEGEVTTGYSLPGKPLRPQDDSQSTGFNVVSWTYFQAMQIGLRSGRGLAASDTAAAAPVAVINAAMARTVFAGANPLGQRIRFSWGQEPWRTIVGVVGDERPAVGAQPSPAPPIAYVPLAQAWVSGSMQFVLRTQGEPLAAAPAARRALASLDALLPLAQVESLDGLYADAVAEPRFRSALALGFAALALLLAAAGLYSLLHYAVGGRTREFGVRAALGARPGQVMALVLRQALALLGLGLALGGAAAWVLMRLLAGLLYGVSPTDPWVWAAAAGVLAAAGVAAAWLPARRALRVDAAQALRAE